MWILIMGQVWHHQERWRLRKYLGEECVFKEESLRLQSKYLNILKLYVPSHNHKKMNKEKLIENQTVSGSQIFVYLFAEILSLFVLPWYGYQWCSLSTVDHCWACLWCQHDEKSLKDEFQPEKWHSLNNILMGFIWC